MPTFLVTANIPELWAGATEVVTIDGILPNGKHFIQDPSVRVVENITSADILCHVTEEEFAEANRAHDELLEELGRELNRLHGVDHPTRFWLILFGPWLRQFTHVVFCRWYTLREVLRRHPDAEMRVVDVPWEELTPQTHEEGFLFFMSEPWNSWIYGTLLARMRGASAVRAVAAPAAMAEFVAYRADRHHGLPRVRAWSWQRRVAVRLLARLNRRAKGVVYATVFSTRDLLKFFWYLRLVPQVWDSPVGLHPWRIGRPALLGATAVASPFARDLAPLVGLQLPAIYVEGFADLTRASSSLGLPMSPEFVFSHTAYLRNDAFKLWAADRAMSAGTRLVSAQHGGGYGINPQRQWGEAHELAATDRFFSWGSMRASNVRPLGVQRSDQPVAHSDGALLIVLGPVTRMSQQPLLLFCSDVQNQRAMIETFMLSLPSAIRNEVRIRPKPSGDAKPARMRVEQVGQLFGSRHQVGHRSSLLENLSTSRLVVLTYNETTFPITLSSGYPTIALWREEFLQANGEATEVFRALHQCGIIHHCPIEAATLVAEIWNDVDEWWSSREVRVARDLYTRMFSRRLTDVAKETASALRGDLYSTVR